MPTSWSSDQYLRFAEERTRPCRDLAARVRLAGPRRIVDLGSGPGNSTVVLAERWPEAEIVGVDSSPEMLARARRDLPALRWEEGDIGAWAPERPFDLVFSNAAFQWVPDHAALLPRLFGHVAPGGALAFQVPGNWGGIAHRLMRELAASSPFRDVLGGAVREWYTHPVADYHDILAPHAAALDLWVTEYQHVLPGVVAIAEWYRGTGLRPYLDALPDDALRERFVAAYTERLAAEYPARRGGVVIFPFERIFVIATRA